MAFDGFWWLPMASDGFRWLPMASDGFRWLPMASDGFGQVGVLAFGGTIYHGDAFERTANVTGADPLYTYCNFNDFGSAIVTLFELLVVNNWQVVMAAVVVVDGQWSRWYFFSWCAVHDLPRPSTPFHARQCPSMPSHDRTRPFTGGSSPSSSSPTFLSPSFWRRCTSTSAPLRP